MKVLHINKSDAAGGASVAAMRIVNALNKNGIDAKMLVVDKKTNSPLVETITSTKIKKYKSDLYFLSDVVRFLPYEKSNRERFSYSRGCYGFDLSSHPAVLEADIIHLHWLNQGFLSLNGLKKIVKTGKPVVWTLHDMWSFTGGCHYSGKCLDFKDNCGNCQFLRNPKKEDISFKQFNFKKKIYADAPIYPVTCSNWLAQTALQSDLLKYKPIISIPNPIDIDVFKPCDKSEARKKLGLPQDKKLILFGAANVSDPRKGIMHLISALNKLAENENKNSIELIIFGKNSEHISGKLPFIVYAMNYVSNTESIVNLYNAADLFVLPSMEDNLPNTVMEALACGLPVVAFNTGGVPEMVTHKQTGFLASLGNEQELAEGLHYLLTNSEIDNFRINARKKVEENFAPDIVASRYKTLYNSLMK
jgi:glycosyltransferase involved in cell wall biosynthesis